MRRVLAVALMTISSMAWATLQMPEIMIVDDEPTLLLPVPLAPFLDRLGIASNFHANVRWRTTANWRGYQGTWEIRDNPLYLLKLNSQCRQLEDIPIDAIIPGAVAPVKATWFSGDLMVPLTGQRMRWSLDRVAFLDRFELITLPMAS